MLRELCVSMTGKIGSQSLQQPVAQLTNGPGDSNSLPREDSEEIELNASWIKSFKVRACISLTSQRTHSNVWNLHYLITQTHTHTHTNTTSGQY